MGPTKAMTSVEDWVMMDDAGEAVADARSEAASEYTKLLPEAGAVLAEALAVAAAAGVDAAVGSEGWGESAGMSNAPSN